MKLRSLLLASSAVLVSVTASHAADAIVVEPEPVEYVRVCDAYGAGWWYIPGTEYCLKFDGDVRVQYGSTHYHDIDGSISDHEWNYRARLNVRAANETEYGTLLSRVRFVADTSSYEGTHYDYGSYSEGPGSASTVIDTAWMSLAGFRLGFDDSYWHRAADYGYYEARFDGLYLFQQGIFFDYTFEANGWTATIGVEDGNSSGSSGQPDVYGGITYSTETWYFAGVVYYDSSMYNEYTGETDSGIAYHLRADYDMSAYLPGGKIGAFYMSDDGETDYVKGHTWGVTAKMNLTDNMILFGGYSDYADQFNPSEYDASATNWTVGVAWDIVPGLRIQPEYTVTTYDNEYWIMTDDGAVPQYNNGRFSLRVERSF